MQYNLSKLKPTEIAALDKLPVRNQDAIIAKFGEPFVPSKAFFLLRDATANFTKTTASDVAYQLDAKLWEWSQKAASPQPQPGKDFLKEHIIIGSVPKHEPAAPPPQETKSTGDNLREALEALQTALEFADDPTTQNNLREAVEALQVALEFA